MDSALSEHGNLQLMWQLLHDASWRLPTAELDLLWTDALGDSDPMQVGIKVITSRGMGLLVDGSN